jgi:ABC-type branched-subunit amino acid transport system substrate-binding protein
MTLRPKWKWISPKRTAGRKLAILHDKGDYGKGLAEFAKGFVEADPDLEMVLYEGITPGAVDYSAVVQKIKRSAAPKQCCSAGTIPKRPS